jgi:hypothetical protein
VDRRRGRGAVGSSCVSLFYFLPNLEEIDLTAYSGHNGKYIEAAFKHIARNQSIETSEYSPRRLKTISLAYSATEFGMSTEAILPFCTPPSVSKVTARMVATESFTAATAAQGFPGHIAPASEFGT